MTVRDLAAKPTFSVSVKWLPLLAAVLVLLSGVLSQGETIRYQDFTLRSSAPQWFEVQAPNGSYGFVAVTAKKPDNTPVPTSVPDSDGDGIGDPFDACPGVPGIGELQGCPPPTPTPKPVLPALPATGACVLATQSGLAVNVRESQSTSARIVGSISYSQIVPVLGMMVNEDGETWYQVAAGWVAARVVRLGGDCTGLQAPAAATSAPTTGAPPPVSDGAIAAPAGVASGPLTVDKANSAVGGSRGILQLHDPSTGRLEFTLLQNGDAFPLPDFGVAGMIFPALQPTSTGIAFFTGDASGLIDLRLADLNRPGMSTILLSARADLRIAPFPPSWSPDGSALLVTLIDPITNTSGVFRLSIQNGALAGEQPLASGAFAPVFSHEGNHVAYVTGGLLNRVVQVLSLVDNTTQSIAGAAPFNDCTKPVFGVSPADLLFVCTASGQTLLVRENQGSITPVAAPATIVWTVSTGSRHVLVTDGSRVYAAPLNAMVFTPVVDAGGKIIEYFDWLQGEGIAAG